MLKMTMQSRWATPLVLAAALLGPANAWAQSPAELAPADVPVYMHISEPDAWFAELTQGPIGQKLREQIESQEGSGDLLAALGMNTDQFLSAYFGGDVVILGETAKDDAEPLEDGDAQAHAEAEKQAEPGVIFSQVSQANRQHAIDSLELKRIDDISGYPTYTGPDGGLVVMLEDWVAMCDEKDRVFLTGVLSRDAGSPNLADTERYRYWTRQLPADRAMTGLVYESEASQHAFGVVRTGKGVDVTYLGTSPDYKDVLDSLGEAQVAEFGPLPASTLMAMSFNIDPSDEAMEGFTQLDTFLKGKSFAKDVMPKISTPMLFFMGAVDGAETEPTVGAEVPVLGVAIKMTDDTVAEDLTGMFDGMMLLANFAVADFGAGAIPQRSVEYGGATFKVAELGKPIAEGIEVPEVGALQVAYGQVGEYYVVCTQEAFFKQCVDAKDAEQLGERLDDQGLGHPLAKKPVIAMIARPDGFAQMMLSWVNLIEKQGLPDAVAGEDAEPVDTEAMRDVVKVFQQFSRMKMQVWGGEDGMMIARIQITAPQ